MNERGPKLSTRQDQTPPSPEAGKPSRMLMSEYARQKGLKALEQHIISSEETDARVGIFQENVTFNPEDGTVEIVIPVETYHQGHKFEENQIALILGGKYPDWADVSSGALAFTRMGPDYVPLHKEISGKFPSMGILDPRPIKVRSFFINNMEGREAEEGYLYVGTEIWQGKNLCFTHECKIETVKGKTAARIASMTKNKIGSE